MMESPSQEVNDSRTAIGKHLRYADIADLFEQISRFVQGGVPLTEALNLMRDGWDQRRMVTFVGQLHDSVQSGSSFSMALSRQSNIIPSFIADIVAAGEKSDELADTLTTVADYFYSVDPLMPNQPSKIKRAFFYPLMVLLVVCIITMMLLIFVVPQFTAMFSEFGSDLPALTMMVVNASETAEAWSSVILIVGVLLVGLWKWGIPRSALIQRIAIRLMTLAPGYRQLYNKGNSALLLLTWGFLLSRGMKISEAISASTQLGLGPYWCERLNALAQATRANDQTALKVVTGGLVTPRVEQLLMLAKRLDNLDSLFMRQGNRYRQQVEQSYRDVTQLLEPPLIIIIGLIVGTIVIAMYLPIFKIGSAV